MHFIETERLILRPSREDEFEETYRILVDEIEGEEFTREAYRPELQFSRSLAQQGLGEYFWRPSVYLKESQRYIGNCLLMPRLCTPEERTVARLTSTTEAHHSSIEAEIGWAISKLYRNEGYATEAARALISYGFHTLQLPQILAFTWRGNPASMRVMEKLGMRLCPYTKTEDVVGVIENDSKIL